MYAVIETGGKQYIVAEGDLLKVEKLEVEKGKTVAFDKVLMVGGGKPAKIGDPVLKGVHVKAEVIDTNKDRKIKVFKKLRGKGYRRTKGHRQIYTKVKITSISAS